MGCKNLKCPLTFCEDKSEVLEDLIISENTTNTHRSNFSIEGTPLTIPKQNTHTPQKYFLQLTELKETNETEMKRGVIVPQPQSDRSNSSKICLTETKDRVENITYSRFGKSFIALLKEFNFVHKLYHKGENINKDKMSISSPKNENESFNCSNCTSNNSKAMSIASCGSLSFNEGGICQKTGQYSKLQIKQYSDNFNKFKNLFYIPVISLTGKIENSFEVSKKNEMLSVVSFSLKFEYFEHFFAYYFNMLHNLKITSETISSFQSKLSPVTKFLQKMTTIRVSYGIAKDKCKISLTFFTVPSEFVDILFPDCLPNSLQDLLVSSNLERESLTIHVVNSGEVEYEMHFIQNSTLKESFSLTGFFQEVMGEQSDNTAQIGKELQIGDSTTSFAVRFAWKEGQFSYLGLTIVRHVKEGTREGHCSELNLTGNKPVRCNRQKAHFCTTDLETEIIYEYSFI